MDKTIEVVEFQNDMVHVLEEVTTAHMPYILTRNSRPIAVMIAYEDYIKLLPREEIWTQFQETWLELGKKNAHFSEEEVEADIELATQELREQRRQGLIRQNK